jgi:parallel beta-helix repeat protein
MKKLSTQRSLDKFVRLVKWFLAILILVDLLLVIPTYKVTAQPLSISIEPPTYSPTTTTTTTPTPTYSLPNAPLVSENIYYIDATNGNDSNNGLSEENAWKTIAKVNASSLYAGDSILLKRDEEWREQLNPPYSGSPGNPITFGAYGAGDDPIINGSDIATTWTKDDGANVWKATLAGDPNQVFFDEIRGTEETNKVNLNAANEWHWESNTLYIYSTSDPDTAYTSPGIEVSIRDGITGTNKDYITIENIRVTKAKYGINFTTAINLTIDTVISNWNYYDGITVQGDNSDNPTLTEITSHDNQRHGILIYAGEGDAIDGVTVSGGDFYNNGEIGINFVRVDNGTIEGVTSYSNTITGIKLDSRGTWNTVSNNTVYSNGGFGIDVDTDITSTTVESNTIYNNASHGIAVEGSGTNNTIVRYNLIYNNTPASKFGIIIDDSPNNNIYYNIIYDQSTGIYVAGYNAFGNEIYNNTIQNLGDVGIGFYSNAVNGTVKNNIIRTATTYIIEVESTAQTGFTSDYNCFGEAGNKFHWGSTTYSFVTWTTNSSQDTHSNDNDPLMTDPDNDDFTLQPNSPCIDAGVDVGLTEDYAGNPLPQGPIPDIGAFEYQTLDPTSTPIPSPIVPPASATPTSSLTPTSTYTLTPSETPSSTPLPGDLNQDGQVNVLDTQLCVNVVLGTETDPIIVARADVNKDGDVNVLDVQEIVNVMLAI